MKDLDQVLMEEWTKIPLDDSIPRRIEAAQKAGGRLTPY